MKKKIIFGFLCLLSLTNVNASENKVVLDFSTAVSENEIIQLIVSSVLNAKYSTKILDDYVSIQYTVI